MGKPEDEITVLPPVYEKSSGVVETVERVDSITEVHDEREPTDEELATLRRVSETIPMRAWYPLLKLHLTPGLLSLLSYVRDFPSMDVKALGAITSKMLPEIQRLLECWV
jgi:hypothetical protein